MEELSPSASKINSGRAPDPQQPDAVAVEYAITDDLPDGRPALPVDPEGSLWALVPHLPDGSRRWRRIALLNKHGAP
jgi:hypothetical protein